MSLALAFALSPFAGGRAMAVEPSQEAAVAASFVMPRTEVMTVQSKAGASYHLYLAWPESPPPPQGYPVLYLLDGDQFFATTAELANRLGRFSNRGRSSPGLVVAIGFPTLEQRSFDTTPSGATSTDPFGRRTGGAEAFRNFLLNELRPMIEARFRVDRSRQALMGHSYSGLFVLDTMFRQPDAFATYVAASPSIWFNDRQVLRNEGGFLSTIASTSLHPRLVMTAGGLEEDTAKDATAQGRSMIGNAAALADRLGKAGVDVRFRILAHENHGTTMLPSIGQAIPLIFGVPR